MFALCKNFHLLTILALMVGMPSLPAAALRWIHLGSHDAELSIHGKATQQKMPPGKITPWADVPSGLHRFHLASEKNTGTTFELSLSETQRITIISVSDKDGNLESRTYGLDKPQGEMFVLNMWAGKMLQSTAMEKKAAFGKGIWLRDLRTKNSVSLTDAEGFQATLDFTRMAEAQPDPFLAILSENNEGKPSLTILRDSDSLFATTSEAIEIPGKLVASIQVSSMGRAPAPGSFDPFEIDWNEVDSQIFWLNLTVGRDPCRLEIGGFPALRRVSSGSGSSFVKWPAGSWDFQVLVERTNEKVGAETFVLPSKSSLGIISSGGGKFPHRIATLKGRFRGESGEPAKPQIRFMNALPHGVLRSVISSKPEPQTITMEPGKISDVIPLHQGGFPGAELDLTVKEAKNQIVLKIPRMPSFPPGDWVAIVHLDDEMLGKTVLTWVEMDQGLMIEPSRFRSEE